MVLSHPAADEVHARHTRSADEPRLECVSGQLPELSRGPLRRGHTQPDDGKGGESQPVSLKCRPGRKRGGELRKPPLHVEERFFHVHRPIKEDIDLGRAPARRRPDGDYARNIIHCLLDGPGDERHHLLSRHHATVNEDDHARKIRLREDRGRHRPPGIGSGEAHEGRQEEDGGGLADDEPGELGHGGFTTWT